MDDFKKFGLIAGQLLFGLGFGFAGAIAFGVPIILYFELADKRLDLFGEIMFVVIGGYLGMQAGIVFDGYKFLKENGRQKEFLRFFFQSLFGLIMGFLTIYLIVSGVGKIPNWLVNFLLIVFPMAGAIIGFSFGLTREKKTKG